MDVLSDKEIDSTTITYLHFLINKFQSEIDINMSFLNCNYTKTVQLLSKCFLKNIHLTNKIDVVLAQAFVELSNYFVSSFDIIHREHYEQMCSWYLKIMSLENAKKQVEEIKTRNYEDLILQHNHFMYIMGEKHARI